MIFDRFERNTLGATLVLGAALLITAACDDSTRSSKKATDRGNQFPRTVAADPDVDRTAIAPATEPMAPAREPSVVELDEPEASSQPRLPESYDELMSAGKELLDGGDHELALAHFEKAVELESKRSMPHIQVARALIAAGEPGSARGYAEMAVELEPGSSFAWNTLGRVELAEGNRDAAITSFERAADENEDNSYAWNNLGYVHLLAENWQEAATALENATSGHSSTAYMWNNLGLAYEHLDLLVEARASYRQASELGSEKAAASLSRLEGVESIADLTAEATAQDESEELEPLGEVEVEVPELPEDDIE